MRSQLVSRRLFLALLIPATQAFQAGCSRRSEDPAITTPSPLPSATVGTAYRAQLAATGGSGPYTFAITSGSVPAGLTLSSAGLLSGTPTTAGTVTFAVQATNSTRVTSAATTLAVTVSAAHAAEPADPVDPADPVATGATLAADGYPRYGSDNIGYPENYGTAYQTWAAQLRWSALAWWLGYGAPNGYNYQQIAESIWNSGQANGVNSRLTPYVSLNRCPTSLSGGGWGSQTVITACNNAGWWLRTPGYPSGALVPGPSDESAPGTAITNPTSFGPSYTVPATDYHGTYNEVMEYLAWNFLTQGNAASVFGERETLPANTYLCGLFHDNQDVVTHESGSWEYNGTNYAAGDSAITPYLWAAFTAQGTALRSLWSSSVPSGQTPLHVGNAGGFGSAYQQGSISLADLPSDLYDLPFVEAIAGESWSKETYAGFAGVIATIIGQEAIVTASGAVYASFNGAGGSSFSSSSQNLWTATDWQYCRYLEGCLLLRGTGICINGPNESISQLQLVSDTMNAGAGGLNTSLPGNLSWLNSGTNSFDPPQSSAQFSSGIWARNYPGGIVIVNPRGNPAGTVTITVGSGGMIAAGAFKFMPHGGYSDAAVNTGATITASFTLAAGDARILVAI